MGTLRNGTGLRIELRVEEETNLESLGSFTEDVLCSCGTEHQKGPLPLF